MEFEGRFEEYWKSWEVRSVEDVWIEKFVWNEDWFMDVVGNYVGKDRLGLVF